MSRLPQFLLSITLAVVSANSQTIVLDQGAVVASGASPSHALSVYVDGVDGAPALNGEFSLSDGRLRFEPRYPLEPGMRYRVELQSPDVKSIIQVFEIPRNDAGEATRLTVVYPSADVLPENLLRVYLHFSAPMSRGKAYSHISLIDEATDQPVELPFLELEQELWDPAGRRLTVLFDPGRIKRGLVPNVEAGLPLMPGRKYRLRVSDAWLDAKGRPLAEPFEKSISAVAADYDSPVPLNWTITAPSSDSRAPISVSLGQPLDQALALRLIVVLAKGQTVVAGQATLTDNETRWLFTPDAPWQAGRYRLRVEATLEDPSGNSVLRPFETMSDQPQAPASPSIVYLNFDVQ